MIKEFYKKHKDTIYNTYFIIIWVCMTASFLLLGTDSDIEPVQRYLYLSVGIIFALAFVYVVVKEFREGRKE